MVRLIFALGVLLLLPHAGALQLGAAVSAWVRGEDAVYLGTEDGRILRYVPSEDRAELLWTLQPIERVTGPVQPKLFSLDAREGALLWVREGRRGFRVVERFAFGQEPEPVVGEELRLAVVAAWFDDEDGYVLVLLDGEVAWLDAAGRITRRLQVTRSAVGDADRRGRYLALGDEGGLVTLVDLEGGRIVAQSAAHRDKVLAVDLGERWLLSGGRDRRAAALRLATGESLRLKAEFFVYSVALDDEERLAAYTYDEQGTLRIVDLEARREQAREGGFVGVDRLLFWKDGCLLLASEQGWVKCWRWR